MHSTSKHLISPEMMTPHHWSLTGPLVPLIHMICDVMIVERIYLLGIYPPHPGSQAREYDLLILVNDAYHKPMHEFEKLRKPGQHMPLICASVFRSSVVNQLIMSGNPFFSTSCVLGKMIYDAGNLKLAIPPESLTPANTGKNSITYNCFMHRANAFLQGAASYLHTNEYALACFMMHQSVEQAFCALLQPFIGLPIKMHHIRRLLRLARRVDPCFMHIFSGNTEQGTRLLNLLQKAYIQCRYSNCLEITNEDAAILMARCKLLLQKIETTANSNISYIQQAA